MKVLLIELNYDTRVVTSELLRDSGCEVEAAGTSAVARKLLHQEFDLILIDHYTFKHFDLEPELFNNKNVLVMSSLSKPEETFKFLPKCNILEKPFNIQDLESKCKLH